LISFYSNTWFRRLWCVQEVALPTSSIVLCGEFEFPLPKVLRVAEWCWHKNRFLGLVDPRQPFAFNFLIDAFKYSRFLFSLVDLEFGPMGMALSKAMIRESSPAVQDDLTSHESQNSQRTSKISSLLPFIEYSMQFDATEPRDKVFAILGLLQKYHSRDDKEFWALLTADYTKPFAHVARDATAAAILESANLDILSKVYHHDDADPIGMAFPSWVPRLHERWDLSVDPTPFSDDLRVFDVYPWSHEVEAEFEFEGDILELHGLLFGSISNVSPVFTPTLLDSIEETTEQIRTINGMLKLTESDDPAEIVKGFARTLIASKSLDHTDEIYNTFLGWVSSIRKHSIGLFRRQWTNNPEAQKLLDSAIHYNDEVIRYCTNRRFFCTADGFIGLGPRDMSPADVIVAVPGHSMPLVLRPDGNLVAEATFLGDRFETQYYRRGGMPDEYTFVGDCYVDHVALHGAVMHGAFVTALRESDQEEAIFKIR
jgi:hypothetical protein